MPPRIEFSDDQLEQIAQLYKQGQSTRSIGQLFGVDHKVIAKRLTELDIQVQPYYINNKRRLSEAKSEIVRRYVQGETIAEIAKDFSIARYHIKKVLVESGTQLRTHKGQLAYQLNERFFSTIDNEKAAYWLGFIYADGHVTETRLAIRISNKDSDHLRRFQKDIGSNHPIHPYPKNIVGLHITRVDFVRPLVELDLCGKKSNRLPFPDLKTDLVSHFIRGFADGDGGLYYYSRYRSPFIFSLYSDTEQFLTRIQNILIENCQVSRTKLYRREAARPLSRILRYGGRRQVKRIFNYLYQDATVWLPRKRDAVEPYL